ncbi:hypothetical protein [Kitasatospora sp. NPDC057015]|uniref:hypothetical protein n=1 Tax=Kitasatospora sp. NPDC057015 TaxID=3346001 RepID=UPI00363D50ED
MRVIPAQWRPPTLADAETLLHPDGPARADRPDEPIFDELVHRWTSAGRAVPGHPDNEWTALVTRAPWPRR